MERPTGVGRSHSEIVRIPHRVVAQWSFDSLSLNVGQV